MKTRSTIRDSKIATTNYDDLEDDLFDKDWRSKAQRLQMRRWHEVRRKIRQGYVD